MATYTTNFSSWSDFEDRIAAFQDYEDSYAYQAVQNVAADLTYDLFFADPYSYTFSATSITAYYYGATAHLYGSNFGTASATVTRADITNGTYTLVLKGSVNVGGVNPTGTITSLDLSGGGYSEHAVGQIPLSGLNGVFSSWSNTYPTTLGSLTLAGTGTRTVSSSGNTTTTYSAISLADGAGNTTSLSGLKFTISDNSSTPVDYVELMRSLLGGNDTANGSAGNNELYTFAGNDTLDGKAGADTMVGGVGNDIYIVDNIGDLVVEDPAQGTDLVKSSIGYLLPDNVENLTLTATAAINATGNELANILTGNAGGNTLTGNEGNDTLNGGSGDDVLLGEFDETNLNPPGGGGIGLIGYGIADVLSGGSGNDFLDGGIGDDIMLGGIGNDTYVVTSTADVVSELANEGSDTVFSLVSYVLPGNVENLNLAGSGNLGATGNALNNRLIGNSGRNVMIGGAGNDTIDGGLDNDYLTGGAGADNLQGGEGDDVFLINSVADFAIGEIIDGGSGINELGYSGSAAATLVLTSLVTHIGTVRLESVDGDINIDASATVGAYDFYMIVGNYGNNRLIGNSGDNSIFGKFGNDTLIGGGGNDLLAGNDGNDVFLIGAGTDHGSDEFIDGGDGDNLIRFTSSTGGDTLTLSTHITNVQGIAISDAAGATRGKTALSLNAAAMSTGVTLTGNAAINTLTGGDGNDTLIGGAGADSLVGGLGDDSYGVDNALDKVTENDGEGTDSVLSSVTWTLAANLEHLTLTGAAAINATGNELANILTGNAAANILNGGIGADTMIGGSGNDTYVVDDEGDLVSETTALAAGGNDLVQSAITYILGANLERLTLTGTAAIDGTGNALANLLTGNTGNNTLDGGDGKDTLVGGLGDDTYLVDLTATGALHDVITEAASAGTDSVILRGTPGLATPVTLTLAATLEHLDASATGTTKLNLTGNTLANTLTGNDADNTLTGGTGNDALIGGLGNDTYVLDSTGDLVTELDNQGTDLVRIAIATANQTYILGDHVENGTLINTVAFNLTGNDAGNTLTGNAAINTLTGGDGNDTLIGGAGADSLVGGLGDDSYGVDNALDKITENDGEGTDSVLSSVTWTLAANLEHLTLTGAAAINATGNELANILTGNAAANILNGGIGADTMIGGNGNDTYVVDDEGDLVSETTALAAGGNDLVQSAITYELGANLERLTLTGTAAIDGTGNALANLLTGNAGNNTLDGGDGKDTLVGGLGDDSYLVDLTATGALQDVITEAASAGTDSVILRGSAALVTPATLTLAATLEHLDASGTGTTWLNLTGNTLANTLIGNDADNTLTGGTGNDALIGGLGNDTYVLDNAGDGVTENADEGTDLVRIAIATANQTYILGEHVENGTLINTVAFNLTGNELANILTGNAAINTLTGGDGNDSLNAGAGNDALNGGNGNDLLDGGLGKDALNGGAGDDSFIFSTAPNATTNSDTIADFTSGQDTVLLGNSIFTALGAAGDLNPDFFHVGTSAHDADDHIVFNAATGALYYDPDGTGATLQVQFATLAGAPVVVATDFVVGF